MASYVSGARYQLSQSSTFSAFVFVVYKLCSSFLCCFLVENHLFQIRNFFAGNLSLNFSADSKFFDRIFLQVFLSICLMWSDYIEIWF